MNLRVCNYPLCKALRLRPKSSDAALLGGVKVSLAMLAGFADLDTACAGPLAIE